MKFIFYGKCIKSYAEKTDEDKYLRKNTNIHLFIFQCVYCRNSYIIEIQINTL